MTETSICDLCHTEGLTTWVDGKTRMGPWANMCLACYAVHGRGLGVGVGQYIEGGIVIRGGSKTNRRYPT